MGALYVPSAMKESKLHGFTESTLHARNSAQTLIGLEYQAITVVKSVISFPNFNNFAWTNIHASDGPSQAASDVESYLQISEAATAAASGSGSFPWTGISQYSNFYNLPAISGYPPLSDSWWGGGDLTFASSISHNGSPAIGGIFAFGVSTGNTSFVYPDPASMSPNQWTLTLSSAIDQSAHYAECKTKLDSKSFSGFMNGLDSGYSFKGSGTGVFPSYDMTTLVAGDFDGSEITAAGNWYAGAPINAGYSGWSARAAGGASLNLSKSQLRYPSGAGKPNLYYWFARRQQTTYRGMAVGDWKARVSFVSDGILHPGDILDIPYPGGGSPAIPFPFAIIGSPGNPVTDDYVFPVIGELPAIWSGRMASTPAYHELSLGDHY